MNKSKRKRKYDPKRKLAKFTHSRASKVYCYDAKCFTQMQFGGDPLQSTLPLHVKKQIMYSVADDVHHWNIMLLTFETDGVKQWVHDWIIPDSDIGPARSNELTDLLDGTLEKKVGTTNPNHLTCWAWYAVPYKDADLESMKPEIIDMFVKAGAFDRELCNDMNIKRIANEKAIGYLEAG